MTFSHYDDILFCSWSGFLSPGIASKETWNSMYADQLLSGNNCYHWLGVLAAARFKGIIHPIRNRWELKKEVLFLPGLRHLSILQEYFQESIAKQ